MDNYALERNTLEKNLLKEKEDLDKKWKFDIERLSNKERDCNLSNEDMELILKIRGEYQSLQDKYDFKFRHLRDDYKLFDSENGVQSGERKDMVDSCDTKKKSIAKDKFNDLKKKIITIVLAAGVITLVGIAGNSDYEEAKKAEELENQRIKQEQMNDEWKKYEQEKNQKIQEELQQSPVVYENERQKVVKIDNTGEVSFLLDDSDVKESGGRTN